jgi:uncharacterized protein with HEPN domain/predicted nucleotidyltransferase
MRRAKIEIPGDRVRDFCRRHHVRRLALFGSVLRDDFRPDSDVDVIVEFEDGHAPGLDFFAMQEELSSIIGRTVDLNTPRISEQPLPRQGACRRRGSIWSRHESLVRLRHMLDHAREAVAMAAGKTRDDLDTDRKLNLALVRLLEIVGEAANRTPADERAQYSEIPWGQIVGLRNRLIHSYDSVDFDILWQIINLDFTDCYSRTHRLV